MKRKTFRLLPILAAVCLGVFLFLNFHSGGKELPGSPDPKAQPVEFAALVCLRSPEFVPAGFTGGTARWEYWNRRIT
jgi:hypothetical protein